jgi:hypothetical protein
MALKTEGYVALRSGSDRVIPQAKLTMASVSGLSKRHGDGPVLTERGVEQVTLYRQVLALL